MRVVAQILLIVVAGCVGTGSSSPALRRFDFGPTLQPPVRDNVLDGTLSLAIRPVRTIPALENDSIRYRLAYANVQETRAYSESRWVMPPPELVRQRLRDQLGTTYRLADERSAQAEWLLEIDLEEFEQVFDGPNQSRAVIRLRASLLHAGRMMSQREFQNERAAPTPDAPGAVFGLTDATDLSISAMRSWLAERMH